jgi:outer membrane receptor protein involved in Fe transport
VVGVDEWHEKNGLNEHEIVREATAPDGSQIEGVGVTAAPYHLVLSPMNYGEVLMQGCDFGFTHFLSDKLIINGNVSWYGTTDFYNELTKKNDPINAPKWKWNAGLKYNASLGDIILNLRHVDAFQWSDGIWSGVIGPYTILDFFYTYHISENLKFNLSALNLNNDIHKELVGGAHMGRQMVFRFTSSF